MRFKDRIENDVVIFELTGKIMTRDETEEFHSRLRQYVKNGKRQFILDLEGVEWTNSSGIGALIAAHVTVTRDGGRLVMCNVTNIRTLLAMTQLIRVFECYDSVEEALEALRAMVAEN
jgi:anti-sigma B factor antagonist